MCLISLWLPPSPWNLFYNTFRDSPAQQGMVMVRRKGVQGVRDAGTSQWKAHRCDLSSPNGRRTICSTTPKMGRARAAPEGAEQQKEWEAGQEQCQNCTDCSDGRDAMSKDWDWKTGIPAAHSAEVEGQNHSHNHTGTTGCGSTGAIQEICSFINPSYLLWNTSSYSETLVSWTNCFHQLRRCIFQVLPVKPAPLYFTLWCTSNVFLKDISQRGKSSHLAHEREQCCENKGQQSTTCSKSRRNTKAAKIEGTLE